MLQKLISALIIVVAIIHIIPIIGVISVKRLAVLYGFSINDPNLEILMRHRAILFGLLGTFLAFAAFYPSYQPLAFIAGFVSLISFLWLSWSVGNHNASIQKVVIVDWIALLCLFVAIVLYLFEKYNRSPA